MLSSVKTSGKILKPSELKSLLKWFYSQSPAYRQEDFGQEFLACQILFNALGDKWITKHIFHDDENKEGYKTSFIVRPNTEGWDTHRLIRLADNIYTLKDINNFKYFLSNLVNKDIVGADAELMVARQLFNQDSLLEFNKETGEKGLDYDLIASFSGHKLAIEVKSRNENNQFELKNFRNSLQKARKQFPENYPGILFIRIPNGWFENEETRNGYFKAVELFLLNDTTRINCVTLFWDKWLESSNPLERIQTTIFHSFYNPNPKIEVDNIRKLYIPDTVIPKAPSFWRAVKHPYSSRIPMKINS
jgi:hypothetical protein